MKFIIALFFLTVAFTASSQTKADDIIGKWMNEDGSARFEIYKSGNEYRGKIIWLKNTNQKTATDQKNPDKSLQNHPLIGLDVITGLSYSASNNNWSGGKLYSPEKGAYADCSLIWVDKNTIKVNGKKYGITKTKIWKRYEE